MILVDDGDATVFRHTKIGSSFYLEHFESILIGYGHVMRMPSCLSEREWTHTDPFRVWWDSRQHKSDIALSCK
jgi:hypothetical protein